MSRKTSVLNTRRDHAPVSTSRRRRSARRSSRPIVLGVDTHQDTHWAAIADAATGEQISDEMFAADADGYEALLDWARGYGPIQSAGVEQTGSYGAGLTITLRDAGITVREVNTTDRVVRAAKGKSDAIDAHQAAIAVIAGKARALARPRTGQVEELRVILRARELLVQQRTDSARQITSMIVTAPEPLRAQLRYLTGQQLIRACTNLRAHDALSRVLRHTAKRITAFDHEIKEYDRDLDAMTRQLTPRLREMPQIGPIAAAQLTITYGELDRFSTEAEFAHATGTAPIPVASGKTSRMRLHRGGDRKANKALHTTIIGRMKNHADTRDYIDRTINRGKTKKEAIRLLKRYLARTVYRTLTEDLATPLDNL